MRAVYRALVAPLATAMCHWCVRRGWTFGLGTQMRVSIAQACRCSILGKNNPMSAQTSASSAGPIGNQAISRKRFMKVGRLAWSFLMVLASNWGGLHKEEKAWTYPALR